MQWKKKPRKLNKKSNKKEYSYEYDEHNSKAQPNLVTFDFMGIYRLNNWVKVKFK